MYTADAAALELIDDARARVGRMMADLADVRRRAGHVDDATRWTARAAERYRDRLDRWRETLSVSAGDLELLDGELHALAVRIRAAMAAESVS